MVLDLKSNDYQEYVDVYDSNCEIYLLKYTKNNENSVKVREKGNKLQNSKEHNDKVHQDIWRLYTKSIALASPGSEELALAYGNRSYIMLHLAKFDESIKDIERALLVTRSDGLKCKLLCRKMTCLASIGSRSEEKQSTWYDIQNIVVKNHDLISTNVKLANAIESAKKLVDQDLSKVDFSESVRRHMEDRVLTKIQSDGKKSCLVATQLIRPGETSVVSRKFYLTAPNSKKFYAYCAHCLVLVWTAIPCDRCRISMYCSESCKNNAWREYHDVECAVLPHLQCIRDNLYYYQVMALRATIKAIREFGGVAALRRESLSGFDINFDDTSFASFYNLNSEVVSNFSKNIIKCTCHLLVMLVKSTDFLVENSSKFSSSELAANSDITFITGLIYKCIAISSLNAYYVAASGTCDHYEDPNLCLKNRCCARGVIVCPLACLMSNDCNPNAELCFTEDCKLVFLCTLSIAKDNQISISYFGTFYDVNLMDRQARMRIEKCRSECNCQACKEAWPSMKDLARFIVNLNGIKSSYEALSEEIMSKWKSLIEYLEASENFAPKEQDLVAFGQDVQKVIDVVGQPHFLTTTLIIYLIKIFKRLYEIKRIVVPNKCW
ncbi:SET and MYND domain-containing protein 4-like [Trichogramma pretiosum]|uniref:SET and MYND domain-containing protein 4-like n=1 Tax=Trichogramma pretiosum TaxID=7493 RepID=UPI000C71B150|nr:SET and MYND domain-containing protein 4-like [Trichogramma pretiosum]